MPDISSDTPTKQITVQSLVVEAPQPYNEGDTLTANEAGALNQTYAENLRNNFASQARKAIEDSGGVDSVDLASFQKEFWSYAVGYEFGIRGAGGPSLDPVMSTAMDLAKGKVRDAYKAKGYKLKDVPAAKIRELAEAAIEKNPAFLDRAKEIVRQREEIAGDLQIDLG